MVHTINIYKEITNSIKDFTFKELYAWAKAHPFITIGLDIDGWESKNILGFSFIYNDIVFGFECDFTKGREGEYIMVFVESLRNLNAKLDCSKIIVTRGNEVDWCDFLKGGYAINRHTMDFENCSGLKVFYYIPYDGCNDYSYSQSADYICYNSMHEKIGYVRVIEECE